MDTVARWLYRVTFMVALVSIGGLVLDLAQAQNALQETGACITAVAFPLLCIIASTAFDRLRAL